MSLLEAALSVDGLSSRTFRSQTSQGVIFDIGVIPRSLSKCSARLNLSMNVKGDGVATAARISALGYPVSVDHMNQLADQIGEKTLFGRVGGAPDRHPAPERRQQRCGRHAPAETDEAAPAVAERTVERTVGVQAGHGKVGA